MTAKGTELRRNESCVEASHSSTMCVCFAALGHAPPLSRVTVVFWAIRLSKPKSSAMPYAGTSWLPR